MREVVILHQSEQKVYVLLPTAFPRETMPKWLENTQEKSDSREETHVQSAVRSAKAHLINMEFLYMCVTSYTLRDYVNTTKLYVLQVMFIYDVVQRMASVPLQMPWRDSLHDVVAGIKKHLIVTIYF
jgi:hypothetical protein